MRLSSFISIFISGSVAAGNAAATSASAQASASVMSATKDSAASASGTAASAAITAPPTKEDSGWVPLFNGTNLDGFYAYFEKNGVVDMAKQDAFTVEGGMIHVPKAHAGGYTQMEGHLITIKEYSWYRVRLDYRYSTDQSSQNAGLVFHIDNPAALQGRTVAQRPRSIEINMRRAESSPWTLWSANGQGPYLTSTVKPGTQLFLPKDQGGEEWTNNPWGGDKRVLYSSFANPEKPMGEWNHGEAYVYGDSLGRFFLNGALRTEAWNFRVRKDSIDANPANRIPCDRGGIGVQSEIQEIWYRNFEIMELEPHTLRALHAKPVGLIAGHPAGGAAGKPAGETRAIHGRAANRVLLGKPGEEKAFTLQGRKVPD